MLSPEENYENLRRRFRWSIPEYFNIGVDVCDKWAMAAERPALIGLASGASFGIAAVSYRGASLSLGGDGFLMQAAVTLAFTLVFQTLVMAAYMAVREPAELRASLAAWRVAANARAQVIRVRESKRLIATTTTSASVAARNTL